MIRIGNVYWAAALLLGPLTALGLAQQDQQQRQRDSDRGQAQQRQADRPDRAQRQQQFGQQDRQQDRMRDQQRSPFGSRQGFDRDRAQQQQQRQRAQRPGDQAPQGWVLVNERIVYMLANEPQKHFTAAIQKLAQDNRHGAAEELRLAAGYLDMQAGRTDEEGDTFQRLDRAAEKLEGLADKVEDQEIDSPRQLQKKFASANLALAKHFQSKAKSALDQEQFVRAGHELDSAAVAFRQALIWSDRQVEQEAVGLLRNTRHVAHNLQQGRLEAQGEDEAQPAAAREGAARDDQARPARAENIREHASTLVQRLGQQIDQLAQQMDEQAERDQQESNENQS